MEKQLPLSVPHLLREKTVRRYIPVSREGLRSMIARGDIPAPKKLGPKVVVFNSLDVLAVIERMGLQHEEKSEVEA